MITTQDRTEHYHNKTLCKHQVAICLEQTRDTTPDYHTHDPSTPLSASGRQGVQPAALR